MTITRKYYDNGRLRYEAPYYKNLRHGIRKWWYENGQPECELPYYQNQRHGLSMWWYENGKPEFKSYHLYGEQVSEEEYHKHKLIEKLACLK